MIRQAIVIGDQANVAVRILEADYETVKTALIVPSKGHLTRNQDPAAVPFEFGPVYASDAFYPAEQTLLHEPFIIRDFRGIVVEVRPIRYRPAVGELQVARRIVVEVANIPGKAVNPLDRKEPVYKVDADFAPIYANLFGNWPPASYKYTAVGETGRCLILTADAFYSQVLPLYQWELQKGIPTILKKLSEVGTTATQIKTYIQTLYDEPASITYIILVGDSAQMPFLRGTAENAPSDPMYVKLAGTDSYPDAFISRISAQNATQVETQVARSIRYEKTPDLGSAGDWYHKASGVASNAYGGGAYDCERANWLRTTLLGYTYTSVDQIYDPGATKLMVTTAINEGRGLVNYIGHGATTYWVTTGFGVTDVYALEQRLQESVHLRRGLRERRLHFQRVFRRGMAARGDGDRPQRRHRDLRAVDERFLGSTLRHADRGRPPPDPGGQVHARRAQFQRRFQGDGSVARDRRHEADGAVPRLRRLHRHDADQYAAAADGRACRGSFTTVRAPSRSRPRESRARGPRSTPTGNSTAWGTPTGRARL